MKVKKHYIAYIIVLGTFFSCVPARKYEELKAKKDTCKEENTTLKSQNQNLEENNKELTASLEMLNKEKSAIENDKELQERSYDLMKNNYNNINATYQLLLDKNKELLAGNNFATTKLMTQLQKNQEELQVKEDALRTLEASLHKKESALSDLNVTLAEREKRVNELESIIAKKDAAVTALKDKVKAALLGFENNGLTIEQKNGKVYVSLDENLLFSSGSYNVGSKGIVVLKKLAIVLEQSPDINVLVEGHTDNVPMKSQGAIADNWDLSVKRATSVVKIMTENSTVNPKRLTAAGRGEYSPLDLSNTAEGRKKNRRIEVILTPKLDELFKLLGE